jgi:hypothetical protein
MSPTIGRTVRSLAETPGFPEAFARAVSDAQGKVCAVCGLERMGHAPESSWLGYAAHSWDSIPATPDMIERAGRLTSLAYRIHNRGPQTCNDPATCTTACLFSGVPCWAGVTS